MAILGYKSTYTPFIHLYPHLYPRPFAYAHGWPLVPPSPGFATAVHRLIWLEGRRGCE